MSSESAEIKIISVDKEAIRISSEKKDFWIIPFKLSLKPDPFWEKKFYEVQQKDPNVIKRRAQLDQDTIKVEVADIDDLQKVLDTIKIAVMHTNAMCEDDYQKKLKIRQELEDLRQRQIDTTSKLKDDSDKLEF